MTQDVNERDGNERTDPEQFRKFKTPRLPFGGGENENQQSEDGQHRLGGDCQCGMGLIGGIEKGVQEGGVWRYWTNFAKITFASSSVSLLPMSNHVPGTSHVFTGFRV